MAADGYLNFNTKINTNGFDNGTEKISRKAQKNARDVTRTAKNAAEEVRRAVESVPDVQVNAITDVSNVAGEVAEAVSNAEVSTPDITINAEIPAESVAEVTNTAQSVNQQIQEILNDAESSERARAARIAAIYRQQGMSMSDSMSRAWNDVRDGARSTERAITNSGERAGDSTDSIFKKVKAAFTNVATTVKSAYVDANKNIHHLTDKTGQDSEKTAEKMKKVFVSSAADVKAAFDMVIGSVRMVVSNFKQLMSVYQTQIEAETKPEPPS